MESKMIQLGQQAVLRASQRLDSQERVSAFLAYSRMVVAMYQAGQRLQSAAPRR